MVTILRKLLIPSRSKGSYRFVLMCTLKSKYENKKPFVSLTRGWV